MGKKSKLNETVSTVFEEVAFIPSRSHKEVKAKLLARLEDNPITDIDSITCSAVVSITKDSRINHWWTIPGFKEWFKDKDEFRVGLSVAANNALAVLEEVAQNDLAPPSSRVAAAKILLEQHAKLAPKTSEEFADERLAKLSEGKLDAIIKQLSTDE